MRNTVVATDQVQAEQVYVTHCEPEDSVVGQGGFSIRAASTRDEALLERVERFPSYRPPPRWWLQRPSLDDLPRRLARVQLDNGTILLVHSTPLGADTRGQGANHFTHFLTYPALSCLDAIQTWGSRSWQTGYPGGARKDLEPFHGIATGPLLNMASLFQFLSDAHRREGATLPSLDCLPPRISQETAKRRRWLAWTLHGILLAQQAPSERAHLYIAAEAGCVAMLIYAAALLLPRRLADQLTFSTYEAPEEAKRFGRTCVIGTFDVELRLDADHLEVCGYGVDTLHDCASAEIVRQPAAAMDRLVALAQAGDWELLADLQELWGLADPALPMADTCTQGVALLDAYRRFKAGKFSEADLLTAVKLPLGKVLLKRFHKPIESCVLEHCYHSAALRKAFAPLLRQHKEVLQKKVVEDLGHRPDDWRISWIVLQDIFGPEDLARIFVEIMHEYQKGAPAQSLPFPVRLELLKTWGTMPATESLLPREIMKMLTAADAAEFKELGQAQLPARVLAQAMAAYLQAAPDHAADVRQALGSAAEPLWKAFLVAFMKSRESLASLAGLLDGNPQEIIPLFERFSAPNIQFSEEEWETLLAKHLQAWSQPWLAYWVKQRHLESVADRLTLPSKFLHRLWTELCKQLDVSCLVQQRGPAVKLLDRLTELAAALKASVPKVCRETLDDWNLLRTSLWSPPAKPAPDLADQLDAACKRRRLKPRYDLMKRVFGPVLADPVFPEDATLLGVIQSLRSFFATAEDQAEAVKNILDEVDDARRRRECARRIFPRAFADAEMRLRLIRKNDLIIYFEDAGAELQPAFPWRILGVGAMVGLLVGILLGILIGYSLR